MTGTDMVEKIEPPRRAHGCVLPWISGGYGRTGERDDTLVRCGVCGRWWISRPCFEPYGPITRWVPVRWYHRAARRRITKDSPRG